MNVGIGLAVAPYTGIEDGNPIFATENRTLQELKTLQCMQDGIEDLFFEYIHNMYIKDQVITEELPEIF